MLGNDILVLAECDDSTAVLEVEEADTVGEDVADVDELGLEELRDAGDDDDDDGSE